MDGDLAYAFWLRCYQVAYTLLFRIRAWGVENVPREGGVILAANHQSFLDPPAVGMGLTRQVYFMARSTLFRPEPLGAILRGQHAIPIARGSSDLAAIRTAVDLLRGGNGLVLFPEGTRTPDGQVRGFQPGFALIAARAKVPIVPVAVDGGFRVWPRSQAVPCWGRVQIEYGEPVPPPEGGKAACVAAAEDVRRRVVALLERVKQHE